MQPDYSHNNAGYTFYSNSYRARTASDLGASVGGLIGAVAIMGLSYAGTSLIASSLDKENAKFFGAWQPTIVAASMLVGAGFGIKKGADAGKELRWRLICRGNAKRLEESL